MVGGRKQWKQAMPTASDVRTIALALDGVSAVDHWDRPGYRTKKRIFAVMRPDGLYLNLPEERKQFLFQAAPEVFVRFMWGQDREPDRADREAFKKRAGRPAARSLAECDAFSKTGEAPHAGDEVGAGRNADKGNDQAAVRPSPTVETALASTGA
jgi:hypothetical protein